MAGENGAVNQQKKTQGNRQIEINISTLFSIFMNSILYILAAIVIACVAVFIYSKQLKPQYTSTATLYILKSEDESVQSSSADFSVALNTINDCKYSVTSRAVLDDVIDALGIGETYTVAKLSNGISTSNPQNTRFLNVTATADTPEDALSIVNKVCDVTAEKMEKAQNLKQVNVYSYGKLSTAPSNSVGLKKYALAAIIAAVVVYAVFVAIYFINDSIETDEEFENRLGLTILGSIPDMSVATGKKYYGKKYGKYGKYGKYATYGNSSAQDSGNQQAQ